MMDHVSDKSLVDMNDVPICRILGVNIAAVNMSWLKQYIHKYIREVAGTYICVANVHTTVTASRNPEYMAIQNGSLLTIPDGGPLSTVGRKRGYSKMQRVTGPNLMDEIFSESHELKYRHFFYGSSEETLQKLKKNLTAKYPDINIVGMISPPYRSLSKAEDDAFVTQINNTNPDFVWVGLGAPKQEIWMSKHKGKLNGLMIGVGAGFDYFAGNIKRAPLWMQKADLEWVYRLTQDPVRLFRRYWDTNLAFIWKAFLQGK